MEGLCCVLGVIGAVWLLVAWQDSNKKKRLHQEQQAPPKPPVVTRVTGQVVKSTASPPALLLPDWPLADAVSETEEWLGKVGDSARAARQVNAPVPVDQVQEYLDQGWDITEGIARKINAIAASHGSELRQLPRKTRGYLDQDRQNLGRLNERLMELRDDLTNLIAAGGNGTSRKFRQLDDDIHALGQALRQFTD